MHLLRGHRLDQILRMFCHNLGQVGHASLHCGLHRVELFPKILLDCVDVTPSVHSVGFDIGDFLLELSLLLFFALNILNKVGVLRGLYNEVSHLLSCLDLLNFHLFFEPLLDDFRDAHVVDFLRSCHLLVRDHESLRVGFEV